jgi:hypothetical protein
LKTERHNNRHGRPQTGTNHESNDRVVGIAGKCVVLNELSRPIRLRRFKLQIHRPDFGFGEDDPRRQAQKPTMPVGLHLSLYLVKRYFHRCAQPPNRFTQNEITRKSLASILVPQFVRKLRFLPSVALPPVP